MFEIPKTTIENTEIPYFLKEYQISKSSTIIRLEFFFKWMNTLNNFMIEKRMTKFLFKMIDQLF